MGVVDGATPYGYIVGAGPQTAFATPPTVVADPARRSLATSTSSTLNWMREFFETTSNPPGMASGKPISTRILRALQLRAEGERAHQGHRPGQHHEGRGPDRVRPGLPR